MSAGPIIFIIIASAALLFAFRAGVTAIMSALDRLTASVSAATLALSDAAAHSGSATPGAPSDEAALSALADSLDGAVAAYRDATTPKGTDTTVGTAGEDSVEGDTSGGNPLAPSN